MVTDRAHKCINGGKHWWAEMQWMNGVWLDEPGSINKNISPFFVCYAHIVMENIYVCSPLKVLTASFNVLCFPLYLSFFFCFGLLRGQTHPSLFTLPIFLVAKLLRLTISACKIHIDYPILYLLYVFSLILFFSLANCVFKVFDRSFCIINVNIWWDEIV